MEIRAEPQLELSAEASADETFRERPSFASMDFQPVLDDGTQLPENVGLVVAVAAPTYEWRRTAHVAAVFGAPFHDLHKAMIRR